ncbi:MAG TPA: translation initiation factor IF-3 [Firmicutes bacterium]|nr:translation initiation factor IF-3 [Candidatus Fermentithermobacillaceae bacterium]
MVVVRTKRRVEPAFFTLRRCISISQDLRVNEEIKVREVRLISPEGEQLGVVPIRQALEMARERNLDLVEVAPQAKPPVCKLMDYNRWKYEQQKRQREAKKKQRVQDVKELKMRPVIDDHDFNVKAKSARRFLMEGDKVKAVIMFRGREIVHLQLGQRVLERLYDSIKDVGAVERPPKLEGRNMVMVIAPRPVHKQPAPGKAEVQEPVPEEKEL